MVIVRNLINHLPIARKLTRNYCFDVWCTVHIKDINSTRFSNLHAQFSSLRRVSAHERAIFRECSYTAVTKICFSDCKNINSDITNVFKQIIILYTATTTIQLDGSWLQYMCTPWRWPSHEPKCVGGKIIVHVSWKILCNSYGITDFDAVCTVHNVVSWYFSVRNEQSAPGIMVPLRRRHVTASDLTGS